MELQVHHYVQSRLTERNQGYKQCLNKLPWIKTLKQQNGFSWYFKRKSDVICHYMLWNKSTNVWCRFLGSKNILRSSYASYNIICEMSALLYSERLSFLLYIRQRDHLKCGPLTTSPSISQFKWWKQPVLIQKHPSWEQSTFLYKQFNSYTTQSTYRNFQLHLIFWFMSKKRNFSRCGGDGISVNRDMQK